MIYIVRHGQTDWNVEGRIRAEYDWLVDFNDPNERRFGIETITDFRSRISDFFGFKIKIRRN